MLMGSVTKNSSMKERKEGHYIFLVRKWR